MHYENVDGVIVVLRHCQKKKKERNDDFFFLNKQFVCFFFIIVIGVVWLMITQGERLINIGSNNINVKEYM